MFCFFFFDDCPIAKWEGNKSTSLLLPLLIDCNNVGEEKTRATRFNDIKSIPSGY